MYATASSTMVISTTRPYWCCSIPQGACARAPTRWVLQIRPSLPRFARHSAARKRVVASMLDGVFEPGPEYRPAQSLSGARDLRQRAEASGGRKVFATCVGIPKLVALRDERTR